MLLVYFRFYLAKRGQVTKRFLIVGGSGFVGTHLAERLHSRGATILSLDLKAPRRVLANAKYILGDVRELRDIEFGRLDRIYNLAAIHTTPGHADHEYYDTNVMGAIEVCRLAEKSGCHEVIFTSSISVYGPSELKKCEDSHPRPNSAYGRSKLIAEKVHQDWQRVSEERRLTIVRPAVIFGEGEGGNFDRMASLLRRGVFVFPGRRDTIKSCIHIDDLLDLVDVAATEVEPYVLLNAAYADCPTLERIVGTLQSKYFPDARLIDVPPQVVLGAAKLLGLVKGVGLGIHPERVTKLLASTYVYPQWAVQRGLLPIGSFEAGIDRWAASTPKLFQNA